MSTSVLPRPAFIGGSAEAQSLENLPQAAPGQDRTGPWWWLDSKPRAAWDHLLPPRTWPFLSHLASSPWFSPASGGSLPHWQNRPAALRTEGPRDSPRRRGAVRGRTSVLHLRPAPLQLAHREVHVCVAKDEAGHVPLQGLGVQHIFWPEQWRAALNKSTRGFSESSIWSWVAFDMGGWARACTPRLDPSEGMVGWRSLGAVCTTAAASGLAWEELSCSGHLGTSHWPECPAPHPHCFSSFLPFSFLINHTLLPNLNMEMPRLGDAIIHEARPAVRALGLRGASRLSSFLMCVKLCAQKAPPYLGV